MLVQMIRKLSHYARLFTLQTNHNTCWNARRVEIAIHCLEPDQRMICFIVTWNAITSSCSIYGVKFIVMAITVGSWHIHSCSTSIVIWITVTLACSLGAVFLWIYPFIQLLNMIMYILFRNMNCFLVQTQEKIYHTLEVIRRHYPMDRFCW